MSRIHRHHRHQPAPASKPPLGHGKVNTTGSRSGSGGTIGAEKANTASNVRSWTELRDGFEPSHRTSSQTKPTSNADVHRFRVTTRSTSTGSGGNIPSE